ncbi:MAG TPA: hypothetical protein VH062_11870 [Polyangiaceae bacterium]|nr:hypothetical protein [Polyangiaceae bacterium]
MSARRGVVSARRGVVSARRAVIALGVLAALAGCEPRITTIGAEHDALDATPDAPATTGRYLEAEEGTLSGGFVVSDDRAASGRLFIHSETGESAEDAPGSARALYDLVATETGMYLVWGRIHAQDISVNRFWVQVDDGTFYKWRITTGDIWYWDAFHDNVDYGVPIVFALSAGTHRLTIANCVDGPGLDRLYYAPDRSQPLGNDTVCDPPHSIDVQGACEPSCGSRGGQCGGPACTDLPAFATYDCAACCLPDQ